MDTAFGGTTGTADTDVQGQEPLETSSEAVGAVPPASEVSPPRSIDDIEHLLGEVEGALARLDDGTYGRCSTCDATIDDDRLAAAPTTTSCATCDVGTVGPG